jgi:antitoxin component HigA of HigAB toxin-antitoxin module
MAMTDLWDTDEYQSALERERLILDATELVESLMGRQGVNRAELARRLHKSRSHVSQVLAGSNMTLGTLAEMARVLGHRVKVTVE